ncbi:TPM domain-containing protein [Cyanobium sp. Morenito 9A2]|uniref:TPM domain-containing protein n=1 Tax=Cyanobium sp. Morenito 9A2 TaxID=2823718 RepID=UPI0020CC2610|nr:TPM domain-containing protein [Cyanobium sp. Morenito 9A2]MCP9850147.1 TPM domain-containing protein [Cyanobium sp. Morenito 9A2]
MGRSVRTRQSWGTRLLTRLVPSVLVPALFSLALVLLAPALTPAALAADNPQLLPDHPTPVIDLARALSEAQRANLEQQLSAFEQSSGWKLRVLTQYERTPGLAVKDFWNLDERSLLLVADPRGGNLLNFNVGDALFALMPRTFWVELQTRFGNQYYVRDHGEDGAIEDALTAVETCLERGGCQVVPGLPREQWILTFCTSALGGVVAGFAAFPRKSGEWIAWAWVLLLAPLWGILFVALGLGPVVTRTSEVLPVLRNVLGFAVAAVASYFIAQRTVGDSRLSENP